MTAICCRLTGGPLKLSATPSAVKRLGTLVTKKDLAHAMGVTPAAVSTALRERIKAAVVVQDGRELVDLEMARDLWKRNTKPRRRNGPRPELGETAGPEVAVAPARRRSVPTPEAVKDYIMGLPEDQIPSDLSEITRRKEHYNAELARLKALKDRGELGSVESMRTEAMTLGKAVRDGVLGVVPRVSADLAALGSTFEVEQLLLSELKTALRVLADG